MSLSKLFGDKANPGTSFKKATDEELEAMVWRGRMVAQLREQDFFKHHLVPAMAKELDAIRSTLEWRPGMTEPIVEKIAMDRVWKSGMIAGASLISNKMNEMLYEAEQAQREIDSREKNGD